MSGYKRVNYYELCRLCTSTEGKKIHIYKEEGCKRQFSIKIKKCLPLKMQEHDLLPKMICNNCAEKLEEFDNFRQLCLKAESMLQSFRLSLKFNNMDENGKLEVYVKDMQPQLSTSFDVKSTSNEINYTNLERESFHTPNNTETEKQFIALMTVSGRVCDEIQPIPLQCSLPLKLNGVSSSMVPVNLENISSLMQIIPETNVQQLKIPIQPDLNEMNHASITQCNVTLPSNANLETVQKQTISDMQSLRDSMNENTSLRTVAVQETSTHVVPLNATVPAEVSLVPSTHSTSTIQNDPGNMVLQINLRKDIQSKNCPTCNKILDNDSNHICNNTNEQVDAVVVSNNCTKSDVPTSTVQTFTSLFSPAKTYKCSSVSENGFECDICAKPFRKKEHLFQHRRLHTGERPYLCGCCGKSFSRKEHLFRHTLAHTGERMHACNICGKTFSRKDNLHKHHRIHGITGPYQCTICGKSFIIKHYFLNHLSNNHGTNVDEKLPFQCDICEKRYLKKSHLTSHKIKHKMSTNKLLNSTQNFTVVNNQIQP